MGSTHEVWWDVNDGWLFACYEKSRIRGYAGTFWEGALLGGTW